MNPTVVGAIVRTALAIAVVLVASWVGLGRIIWAGLCGTIIYSVARSAYLKKQQAIVHFHRSLMHASGFRRLFSGNLKRFAPTFVTYTETEKSNTLNAALELLWPSVKAAVEEIVLASMTGVLAMYRPSFLHTLKFDVFELTHKAPKVVSVDTVQLEDGGVALDIRLTLRGDSNIVLVAAARAFKASIRVRDLQVEATIRQLLSPLSTDVPFFDAMSTSFVGKPRLSYTLQAGKVPFHLERFIKDLLDNILANLLVWPKKLVVPMIPDESRLSFLMSSAAQGVLRVKFIKAEQLINSETVGTSDPYVSAMIRGDCDIYKTKTIMNNLNPVWNEMHEFQVYNSHHDTLSITVFDKDKANDEVMGSCQIDIDTLVPDNPVEMQRPLVLSGRRGAGIIHLMLEYKPFVFNQLLPEGPYLREWSAGYLYVDIRKCQHIPIDKSVKVSTTYADQPPRETFSIAPYLQEAVFEQGFVFPVGSFHHMDTKITFTLDRKLGSVTHEFDAEDLYTQRQGQYVELQVRPSGVKLAVHLTLRAVGPDVNVGSRRQGKERLQGSVRKSNWNEDAASARRNKKDRQMRAIDSPESDTEDMTNEQSRRNTNDSAWNEVPTSEGVDPHSAEATTTESNPNATEGQPAHVVYLQLAKRYALMAWEYCLQLPSDVQGSLLLCYFLFVIYSLSYVWQLSTVGWLFLLSTIGFALHDAYRRSSSLAPSVVNRESDLVDEAEPLGSNMTVVFEDALPAWCIDPSWDKVEWLNELLGAIWPKAKLGIRKIIDDNIKSALSEARDVNGQLPFIDDVRVEVTFGKPPLISAIRAINNMYVHTRVIVDLDLEIGDDIHIMAYVTKKGYSVPIELRDFCFTARVRAVLRDFVPVFPCFANVDVSLLEVPKINFNLNVAYLPIMDIPFLQLGLNYAIDHYVMHGVEGLDILWPRVMSVEVFDPNDIVVKRSLRVPPAGILRVHVVNAQGLRKVDRLSESDPYVTIIYQEGSGVKVKTKVIDDNPNPVWDEDFDFVILNRAPRYLSFAVKDDERIGPHQLLGDAEITTDTLMDAPDTIIQRKFEFQYMGRPAGNMNVEFEFKPFTPTVDKAYLDHDLETKAIGAVFVDVIRCTGLSDVSASKVTVTLNALQESTSVKSGENPVFHEKMHFPIRDILTSKIQFSVVEALRMRKNRVRGTFAYQLKQLAQLGEIQDSFDLEGGGRIELRMELRTIAPDEEGSSKRILSWDEYLALRQKIEAEKQEEVAAVQTQKVVKTETPSAEQSVDNSPEFADVHDQPPVEGAPTRPGILIVSVLHGDNLPAANSSGFSDPFVSIECEQRKKKTGVKKRTINPQWHERLDFRVEDPLNSVISFSVKDHAPLMRRNKTLGTFSVPVSSVSTLKETIKTYQLDNVRGTVTVGLMFQEGAALTKGSSTSLNATQMSPTKDNLASTQETDEEDDAEFHV
eukprot:m.106052 g.106052  ORF g.106052 m.106052 type:complete len:1438 (-) comp15139_c0_seq1:235-4548(-)